MDVVVPLLMAYELNPSVFGDDWNIPESGNGVPDILDEVRWECDWLLRMQMPDGSVCNRVTERTSKPGVTPDKDTPARAVLHAADELGDGHLRREPGVFLAGDRQVSGSGGVCPHAAAPRRRGPGRGWSSIRT